MNSNVILANMCGPKVKVKVYYRACTVLSPFLAHAPLSEHAPLLEYSRLEVNRNIYNTGAPAYSINSQNMVFRL